MHEAPKQIVITPGEPAGIGPDLCILLAQKKQPCRIILAADPDLLHSRAEQLGLPLQLIENTRQQDALPFEEGTLGILPVSLHKPVEAGKLDPANAEYVLETLRKAAEGCQKGMYHALVTGPVHKGVINNAGIPFSGHTEFLADLCHARQVVMMLATTGLRVALATTHLPLREVSDAITPDLLERVIRILHQDLGKRMRIADPRILVCGLNPHAGEGGHLGREEIEVIEPVLDKLRQENLQLVGPLPADTLFVPKYLKESDAVLAMYHDQGLPVLKHMGFGNAVNITLGLPIIRTSVDHGTALELAGTGHVDLGSLEAAILTALDMQ